MKPSRPISLFCGLCLLVGCDFQPDGEVFTTLDPPSFEGVAIYLANYPETEIFLKSETEFHYSVQTAGKPVIETRVLLDDRTVWVTTSPNGTFKLDPEDLETGSYNLKIEFTAASETGSLAEKVGAEVIYVWTERTITVDHSIPVNPTDPNAIAITSVENVDHTIKVSWSAYNNQNFEKYEVLREDFDENGNRMVEWKIPATSLDPAETHLFDYQYLGGKSHYKIKLYAAGKTYTSPPFVYEHPYKPNITYEIKSEGNVTIKWHSLSALKNNFDSYKLEVLDYVGGYTEIVTFNSSSVSDTSITFVPEEFQFGKIKRLRFTINPSKSQYYYFAKEHLSLLRYGQPFPVFDGYNLPLHFNVDTRKFYYRKWSTGILHTADETGQPLDSLDRYYTFLRINNSIGIGTSNDKNYLINLETMTEEGMTALPDGNVFGLSDDKKVAIFTTHEGGKVFTQDGTELLALGYPSSSDFMGISPSGQYVFAQPKIYRFNGTTFESWMTWYAFNTLSVSFLPNEPSSVIYGEEGRIMKYNLETKTSELTTTNYTGPCNFDPVTGKLGCLNGDQFVILNIEDFQPYKALPVQANAGLFYLLNGKVICSSGTQIDLSDIP